MNKSVDALVIGGGVFGCHAAIYLAKSGKSVVLVEQENQLITRASIVNQARLHAGYHYPRSIATASSSDRYVERFGREFSDCINRDFTHYYAIARRGSLTEPRQFEQFCGYLGIKCEREARHLAFNYDQLAAVYATREYSFDPILLAATYRKRVASYGSIQVMLNARVTSSDFLGADRRVVINRVRSNKDYRSSNTKSRDARGTDLVGDVEIRPKLVVNATYASINPVNQQFGYAEIPLLHELSEMAFVKVSDNFKGAALTIMDGPFCSLMPYGKTGLHSLSSVAYTHHKVGTGNEDEFIECQRLNDKFSKEAIEQLGDKDRLPVGGHYPKMLSQLRRYLTHRVALQYDHSRFTVKAKLSANHIDDGRPTEVRLLDQEYPFICLFAGKVNNVYAMEEVLDSLES